MLSISCLPMFPAGSGGVAVACGLCQTTIGRAAAWFARTAQDRSARLWFNGFGDGGAVDSKQTGLDAAKDLPLWVVDLGHRMTHNAGTGGASQRPGQVLTQFAHDSAGGQQITEAIIAIGMGLIAAEKLKHDNGLSDFFQSAGGQSDS